MKAFIKKATDRANFLFRGGGTLVLEQDVRELLSRQGETCRLTTARLGRLAFLESVMELLELVFDGPEKVERYRPLFWSSASFGIGRAFNFSNDAVLLFALERTLAREFQNIDDALYGSRRLVKATNGSSHLIDPTQTDERGIAYRPGILMKGIVLAEFELAEFYLPPSIVDRDGHPF